ncbi:MAG: hypothetical protein FP816_13420 [Desulfobacteraceae bacterium]|nr:hypothetical protein [Desulfobacteraceae bacterium]MBU4001052.1 hypothetical protein [Pseudomonadota bacterium]
MKCPVCKCETFYVKSPDDEFETREFKCPEGTVCFEDGLDASESPEIKSDTETFCQRCAWHGKFNSLQK